MFDESYEDFSVDIGDHGTITMSFSKFMARNIADMIFNENLKGADYFEDNYRTVKKIGEGGFGTVYEAQHREKKENFAVKVVKISYEMDYKDESVSSTTETDQGYLLEFVGCCQEALLQAHEFSHTNIVAVNHRWIQKRMRTLFRSSVDKRALMILIESLLRASQGTDVFQLTETVRRALLKMEGISFYMVMELYETNLKTWLSEDHREPAEAESIIKQLISALSHIHSKGYSHCDFTPANILMKVNVNIPGVTAAITDFGLSQYHMSPTASALKSTNRRGVPPYNSAPDEHLTDKFDMWSLGLVVYDILSPGKTTTAELIRLCQLAKEKPQEVAAFVTKGIGGQGHHMESIVTRCLVPTSARISSSELEAEYNDI